MSHESSPPLFVYFKAVVPACSKNKEQGWMVGLISALIGSLSDGLGRVESISQN